MHCGCSRSLYQDQILSNQRRETVLTHIRSTGGFIMFRLHHRHDAFPHVVEGSCLILIFLLISVCGTGGSSSAPPPSVAATGTPGAQADVGERLFLETRFAQAFKVYLDQGGDINNPNAGDSVVATAETTNPLAPINPGAFKGLSMNCRAC